MVVSMLLPFWIAVTLAPAPKCATMRFTWLSALPSSRAACAHRWQHAHTTAQPTARPWGLLAIDEILQG